MYLDISKAFDKVWHEGLLFKLKTYGVKGELLNGLRNYLHERNQIVVLNDQTWRRGVVVITTAQLHSTKP